MIIRPYDIAKDKAAVRRIFREVAWVDEKTEDLVDTIAQSCRTFVAEVNGEAESVAVSAPGVMRYLHTDIPFAACTGAATSRVARKQGLVRRLLSRVIAADVADGALVHALGMFEQGFYNHLGYGTGSYENLMSFDPAALRVNVRARVPRRLTRDDIDLIHASRLTRKRGHGGVSFHSPTVTTMEVLWSKDGFGLGYCDGPDGELTHHLWCTGKEERGPYHVDWMTFQTRDQFLELMALLKSLGDQVRAIRMREPQGIQFQSLLDRPFKQQEITEGSKFQCRIDARAYWQMRICDLEACLARTSLQCGETRFNLRLSDPIANHLDDDSSWRGIAGDSIITLGQSSGAETGADPSLPTLTASVNAFTRLWLGVGPATGLAITDDLSGPDDLLNQLDQVLCLPQPKPDWDF